MLVTAWHWKIGIFECARLASLGRKAYFIRLAFLCYRFVQYPHINNIGLAIEDVSFGVGWEASSLYLRIRRRSGLYYSAIIANSYSLIEGNRCSAITFQSKEHLLTCYGSHNPPFKQIHAQRAASFCKEEPLC